MVIKIKYALQKNDFKVQKQTQKNNFDLLQRFDG